MGYYKYTRAILSFLLCIAIILCGCSAHESNNGQNAALSTSDSDSIAKNDSIMPEVESSEETNVDRTIHMVVEGRERKAMSRAAQKMQESIELSNNEEVSGISSIREDNLFGDKKFTVMVYMIGSNLEYSDGVGYIGEASSDIAEMLNSGVDFDDVNIIVYTGGTASWANGLPSDSNCVLDLSRYEGDGDLTKTIVATQKNYPSMGNPNTLASFINYCSDHYPAQKAGLIFWDHGNGPLYGYGCDVLNNNDSLLLPEMKEALSKTAYSESNSLEFVGFDACMMASLENARLWNKYAKYLVASEEREPEIGWDYSFLGILNDSKNTEDLVREIVEDSTDALKEKRSDYTLSVMDLSFIPETITAFDKLFESINNSDKPIALSIMRQRSRTKEFGRAESKEYADSNLIDLMDFCNQLLPIIPEGVKGLSEAISKMIIINSSNLEDAYGVSVYYPNSEMPLYMSVFESFYQLVSPSKCYDEYLNNCVLYWKNGFEESKNEDQSNTGGIEDTENSFAFPLTAEQFRQFAKAEYTVYEVNELGYSPVIANVSIDPDEQGVLHVPTDPKVLSYLDGKLGYSYPWRVYQVEHGKSRDVYQVIGAYMGTSRGEFSDFDYSTMPVSLRVTSNEDGSFQTQDIKMITDDPSGSGRQEMDLSHYESLALMGSALDPAMTENGYYLPLTEWKENGAVWGEIVYFDGDFRFKWENTSKYDSNFAVQVTYTDVHGNIGSSSLISLKKSNEGSFLGLETAGGMLRFGIKDDHVELIGYEGSDYEIEIPDEIDGKPVTVIGNHVFDDVESLRKIILPRKLQMIGSYAFNSCISLKDVTMSDSIEEICSNAFSGCSSIEEIKLPNNLRKLSDSSFSECTSLKRIKVPDSLEEIGEGVFSYCASLESIEVGTNCKACKLVDNLLLSMDGEVLLAVPQGIGTYIRIPEGVTKVAYATFAGFKELRIVEFPHTIKEIRNYAFFDCTSLNNIEFPESLETIGAYAFGGSEYGGVFEDKNNDGNIDELEERSGNPLLIGSNVKYIGPYAFEGTLTEEIIVDEGNQVYSSKDGLLMDKSGDLALEIPTGQIIDGDFYVPDGVKGIRNKLFGGNYSSFIRNYHFPASLTYIPIYAVPTYGDEICIYAPSDTVAELYAEVIGVEFIATE